MPLNQTVPNIHGSLRIFFTAAINPLEQTYDGEGLSRVVVGGDVATIVASPGLA